MLLQGNAYFGAVAQLGEHRVCNARVAGSIPVSSTIKFLLFEIVSFIRTRCSICVMAFIQYKGKLSFDKLILIKLLRAYGGCLWHVKTMKDVVSCDKPREGASNR